VFNNEHVLARNMRIKMEQPATGAKVELINSPIKMSGTPVSVRLAPPTIGEHTDSVLNELLGMSADEIAKLRQQEII
jgi:crotonobetainyl-CoA:carnitine CoA-transferase CaiB-like acyl-CoA transferase